MVNQYHVRRVEFVGNMYTRDSVLRRRIYLQEGDVFVRENLVKTLRSLSQLKKIIYPVKLSDVIVRPDSLEKFIDMTICFKERRKSHRVAKLSSKPALSTLPNLSGCVHAEIVGVVIADGQKISRYADLIPSKSHHLD